MKNLVFDLYPNIFSMVIMPFPNRTSEDLSAFLLSMRRKFVQGFIDAYVLEDLEYFLLINMPMNHHCFENEFNQEPFFFIQRTDNVDGYFGLTISLLKNNHLHTHIELGKVEILVNKMEEQKFQEIKSGATLLLPNIEFSEIKTKLDYFQPKLNEFNMPLDGMYVHELDQDHVISKDVYSECRNLMKRSSAMTGYTAYSYRGLLGKHLRKS